MGIHPEKSWVGSSTQIFVLPQAYDHHSSKQIVVPICDDGRQGSRWQIPSGWVALTINNSHLEKKKAQPFITGKVKLLDKC